MYPVATRLFLIVSLLMSLQTSAGMIMGNDLLNKSQVMAHCADMQGMNTIDTSIVKKSGKSNCNVSCCMSFVTASITLLMPVIKSTADFQNIPAQSPSRFTHINYRPPILS